MTLVEGISISTRSTASNLYTREKGVCLVASLIVVRLAQKMRVVLHPKFLLPLLFSF